MFPLKGDIKITVIMNRLVIDYVNMLTFTGFFKKKPDCLISMVLIYSQNRFIQLKFI